MDRGHGLEQECSKSEFESKSPFRFLNCGMQSASPNWPKRIRAVSVFVFASTSLVGEVKGLNAQQDRAESFEIKSSGCHLIY